MTADEANRHLTAIETAKKRLRNEFVGEDSALVEAAKTLCAAVEALLKDKKADTGAR